MRSRPFYGIWRTCEFRTNNIKLSFEEICNWRAVLSNVFIKFALCFRTSHRSSSILQVNQRSWSNQFEENAETQAAKSSAVQTYLQTPHRLNSSINRLFRGRAQYRAPLQDRARDWWPDERSKHHRQASYGEFTGGSLSKESLPANEWGGNCDERTKNSEIPDTLSTEDTAIALCSKAKLGEEIAEANAADRVANINSEKAAHWHTKYHSNIDHQRRFVC